MIDQENLDMAIKVMDWAVIALLTLLVILGAFVIWNFDCWYRNEKTNEKRKS